MRVLARCLPLDKYLLVKTLRQLRDEWKGKGETAGTARVGAGTGSGLGAGAGAEPHGIFEVVAVTGEWV